MSNLKKKQERANYYLIKKINIYINFHTESTENKNQSYIKITTDFEKC